MSSAYWLQPDSPQAHKCLQTQLALPARFAHFLPLSGVSFLTRDGPDGSLRLKYGDGLSPTGPHHCIFKHHVKDQEQGPNGLVVIDVSQDGTWINGVRLSFGVENELKPGDTVAFGFNRETRFIVEHIPAEVLKDIRLKGQPAETMQPPALAINEVEAPSGGPGLEDAAPGTATLRRQLQAKTEECVGLRARLLAAESELDEVRGQLRSEQAHHCATQAVFDAQQQSLEDTLSALLAERVRSKDLLEEIHSLQQRALQNELHMQAAQMQNAMLRAQFNAFQPTLERLGAAVHGAGAQLRLVRTSMTGHSQDKVQQEGDVPLPAQDAPATGAPAAGECGAGAAQPTMEAPPAANEQLQAALSAFDTLKDTPSFAPAAAMLSGAGDDAHARSYPGYNTYLSGQGFADCSPQDSLHRSSLLSEMILAHLSERKTSVQGGSRLSHGGADAHPEAVLGALHKGVAAQRRASDADAFLASLQNRSNAQAAAVAESPRDLLLRAVAEHQALAGQPFGEMPPATDTQQQPLATGWALNSTHDSIHAAPTQQQEVCAAQAQPLQAQASLDASNRGPRARLLKRTSDGMGSQESDVSYEPYSSKAAKRRKSNGAAADSAVLDPPKELKKIKTKADGQNGDQDADKLQMLADLASLDPDLSENEADNTPMGGLLAAAAMAAPHPGEHMTTARRVAEAGRVPVSKHGRRINPRKGIPMHVMATYALLRLPDHEGNLTEMATEIERNELFCKQLDWTARPGTRTYPRWKDALVGCFKPGRYPHLMKTEKKKESLTVYTLLENKIPDKSRLISHLSSAPGTPTVAP